MGRHWSREERILLLNCINNSSTIAQAGRMYELESERLGNKRSAQSAESHWHHMIRTELAEVIQKSIDLNSWPLNEEAMENLSHELGLNVGRLHGFIKDWIHDGLIKVPLSFPKESVSTQKEVQDSMDQVTATTEFVKEAPVPPKAQAVPIKNNILNIPLPKGASVKVVIKISELEFELDSRPGLQVNVSETNIVADIV